MKQQGLPALIVITIALFTFSLTSCLSEKGREQLSEADSLLTKWKEVNEVFSGIDSNLVTSSWKEYESLLDSFQLVYDDTYKDMSWEVSKAFAEVKFPLKSAVRSYKTTASSLEYSGKQLKALREDIEKKRRKTDDIANFLHSEAQELKRIEQEVNLLVTNYNDGSTLFAERAPAMRKLVRELKEHAGN